MDDRFIRDENVRAQLKVDVKDNHINLTLPHEIMPYFYGADNEGDRIVVDHLLLGINRFLEKKGLSPFSNDQIKAILEKDAPIGNKKKLIILHSRSNLILDRRNLRSYRYIQDYDTSVVLNSIPTLLGSLLPPIGEITKIEEKRN